MGIYAQRVRHFYPIDLSKTIITCRSVQWRRATNTINSGRTLPLAQGVKFDVS